MANLLQSVIFYSQRTVSVLSYRKPQNNEYRQSVEVLEMNFLLKKNRAWFVFFIITLYSFLGFFLGFIIWEYFLKPNNSFSNISCFFIFIKHCIYIICFCTNNIQKNIFCSTLFFEQNLSDSFPMLFPSSPGTQANNKIHYGKNA